MNRRTFVAAMGATLAARSIPAARPPLYLDVLKAAEQDVERILPRQQADGGVPGDYELPLAHADAGFLRSLAAVYLAPESRFHRDATLLARMLRAARYLRSLQHTDGTIDLPTTNFGSPPDTAFVVEPVAAVATVLRARGHAETRELEAELERFIRAAGAALAEGGIHTPNHRWVVVAALARCHSLYPDRRYLARIEQWLAEGIDLDPDGNYTERSTGIYNAVCDETLLTAGRLLGRAALFEPVRRNLETMLYFLRPNGEVATDISRRQDRFAPATMRCYYGAYKFLAGHDRNGRFAAMAALIEREHAAELAGELIYFLETPELLDDSVSPAPLSLDYDRHYPAYNFAHIRRGQRDMTLLGGHSRFFSFRNGGAVVEAVRLASAFFGKGQFVAPLERGEGAYRLRQELQAGYYQPLEPRDRRADGDWLAVPRERRRVSNVFRLRSAVEVRERGNGAAISIEVEGTERVPVAIEVTLRPGGRLTGEALAPVPGVAGAHFLPEGFAVYEQQGRALRIGPGMRRHAWTQLRGAEPRVEGLSIYLTAFTRFRHVLEISAV